jgi:hypothetical protein
VKYKSILPNTNIELTNSSVAIFAKSAKISPAEFPAHVVVRSGKKFYVGEIIK